MLAVLAGCGADSESGATDPRTSQSPELSTGTDHQPTDGTTTEGQTADPTTTDSAPKPPSTDQTAPEDQPGGAGDEEPIGVNADFTGRSGRVSPRIVKVPPFIAVTVTLTSADGDDYVVRIGGNRLVTGPGVKHAKVKLAGLHQGGAYTGTVQGGGTVRIEASAEPGP
jgi:hypothetical protein